MKWLTRIWILLTVLFGLFAGLIPFVSFGDNLMSEMRIKAAIKQLYQIHQASFAYAQTHDNQFPDGATSNEAFRKLFAAELLDDEKLFYLKPLYPAQAAGPDGKIGDKASEYREALEPGECCFYMVRSKGADSVSTVRPLIFTLLGRSGGKVDLIPASIGGNFGASSPENFRPEIFTNEYLAKKLGVSVGDILSPEGPLPGPWEMPTPASFWQQHSIAILLGMISIALVLVMVRRKLKVEKHLA